MISSKKLQRRNRIRTKIRGKIKGTATKPRLTVYRSNRDIYAQLVDDVAGKTLASASSKDKGFEFKGNKVDASKQVGMQLAARAVSAGISEAVFDRGGYLYHGRVKSLADGAREGGLKF